MVVFNGRKMAIFAVFLASVFAFIICVNALLKSEVKASANGIKIVLDAGHGGIDDGAIGNVTGAKESEINLSIVNFLKEYLSEAGFSPFLTRTSDAGLYGIAASSLKRKDMEKRKEIIEKINPELVVSVHLNKYPVTTRAGAQVFYKKGDEKGKLLAEAIQSSFNQMEESLKSYSALTGDYYILNCTEIPSVICECGFLSNPREEALLITEEYQKTIAYNIFCGIISYFSINSVRYF